MSKMRIVDPRLKKFQQAMRARLALPENQAKPDWRSESAAELGRMMAVHYHNFTRATLTGDVQASLKYAENIANFAFIFHDTLSWMVEEATPAEVRKIQRACVKKPTPPPLRSFQTTSVG